MGWRTTAQNYNLNRDWLKADAPETRAELGLVPPLAARPVHRRAHHRRRGLPVRPDLHPGDASATSPPAVVAWQKEAFDGTSFPRSKSRATRSRPTSCCKTPDEPGAGSTTARRRRVFPRATSRCGTAPRCCWKRTCSRITARASSATYDLLKAVLAYFKEHPGKLRAAVEQADRETVAAGQARTIPRGELPVDFKTRTGHVPFEFLGVEYPPRDQRRFRVGRGYNTIPTKPVTFTVPFYNEVQVGEGGQPSVGLRGPGGVDGRHRPAARARASRSRR